MKALKEITIAAKVSQTQHDYLEQIMRDKGIKTKSKAIQYLIDQARLFGK